MNSVKPISLNVDDVGKKVASTKKHYTWSFEVDKKSYKIDLFVSLRGHVKIEKNGVKEFD